MIGLKYARWWRSLHDEILAYNEQRDQVLGVVWKSPDGDVIVYEHGTIVVYGRVPSS